MVVTVLVQSRFLVRGVGDFVAALSEIKFGLDRSINRMGSDGEMSDADYYIIR